MSAMRVLPGLVSFHVLLKSAHAHTQGALDAVCDTDGQCRDNSVTAVLPREQVLIQRHKAELKAEVNTTGSIISSSRVSAGSNSLQLADAELASHIRGLSRDASSVAAVLQKGMSALVASTDHFTASPPRVLEGLLQLGNELFECVELLLPKQFKSGETFQKFKAAWEDAFKRIPETAGSIKADIELYIKDGEGRYLVRAVASILEEASLLVSGFMPSQSAIEINKYLDAIADTFDAMAASWGDFTDGKAVDGVEAMYWGLRSIADGLIPESVRNEQAYDLIISALDVVLGSLSRTVLEYERRIMEANVCWRTEKKRGKQRPTVCPAEYVWDGAAECYPTSDTPTTTASSDIKDDYEQFKRGACRGSHAFDKIWGDSKVEGFKGSLENCLEACSANPKCLAAEYKSDYHCELWETEPETTWRFSWQKSCYKRKRGFEGRPIPAHCEQAFPDKQGHYCYASCPRGFQVKEKSEQRCISACAGDFPAESRLMCGRDTGMLARAVLEMVTVVLNSAVSVAENIKKMNKHGVKGELLADTIQTFINMGRPFANPTCPESEDAAPDLAVCEKDCTVGSESTGECRLETGSTVVCMDTVGGVCPAGQTDCGKVYAR